MNILPLLAFGYFAFRAIKKRPTTDPGQITVAAKSFEDIAGEEAEEIGTRVSGPGLGKIATDPLLEYEMLYQYPVQMEQELSTY